MNSQINLQELKLSTEELNNLIVDSIQDIKGKNIVKLDLRQLEEAPCDHFIICEGESSTQVKGIANNIHKRVKDEALLLPTHSEGEQNALWICMDYFDTVVHIFYHEKRSFYQLEELWGDASFTEYETL